MAKSGPISELTESLNQVLSLLQAFRAFDSNNDGQITREEFGGILFSLGYNPSDQEIRQTMQKNDKNRDGLVSLQEFLEMNTQDIVLDDQLTNCLKTAFQALDFEGGNEVVSSEVLYDVVFNNGLLDLSKEDCEAIVDAFDGDGNGCVSLEDLKVIVDVVCNDD